MRVQKIIGVVLGGATFLGSITGCGNSADSSEYADIAGTYEIVTAMRNGYDWFSSAAGQYGGMWYGELDSDPDENGIGLGVTFTITENGEIHFGDETYEIDNVEHKKSSDTDTEYDVYTTVEAVRAGFDEPGVDLENNTFIGVREFSYYPSAHDGEGGAIQVVYYHKDTAYALTCNRL